jgi:hypothetical protein
MKELERLNRIFEKLDRATEPWEPPPTAVTMNGRGPNRLDVEIHPWRSPSRTILTVTPDGIGIRDKFGPFFWTRFVPRREIEHVAGEVFTFANWDPHLAIHTTRKTLRIGWGMEEKTAHDLAVAMREVLQVQ